MTTTRETLSCGCCRGPADDRCACWVHRYTTPARLAKTTDGRKVAHACSACRRPASVIDREDGIDGRPEYESVTNQGLDY